MKTLLVELHYRTENEETFSNIVDGLNDLVCQIASRFSMDIMSVSYIGDTSKSKGTYTRCACTVIYLLNGQTLESVGATLENESEKGSRKKEHAYWYCFRERNKITINVSEISYNIH